MHGIIKPRENNWSKEVGNHVIYFTPRSFERRKNNGQILYHNDNCTVQSRPDETPGFPMAMKIQLKKRSWKPRMKRMWTDCWTIKLHWIQSKRRQENKWEGIVFLGRRMREESVWIPEIYPFCLLIKKWKKWLTKDFDTHKWSSSPALSPTSLPHRSIALATELSPPWRPLPPPNLTKPLAVI